MRRTNVFAEPPPDRGAGCGPVICAGLVLVGVICLFGGPGGWMVTAICAGLIGWIGLGAGEG